jgi:hypothetical protein
MDDGGETTSPEHVKSQRSMSIQSICEPVSDADSDVTLNGNERLKEVETAKLGSLSPREEQAVRALEDLRAGTRLRNRVDVQIPRQFPHHSRTFLIGCKIMRS